MLPQFLSWLRRTKRGRPVHVTLYTRQSCCLCDDARQLLDRELKHRRHALTVIDIDSDPELAARHGSTVPVVAVNGKERFRGVINAVLLRRLLDAEGSTAGS